MNVLDLVSDPYERKARLYPGLFLMAPVAVTAVGVLGEQREALQALVGALAACGAAVLLSQITRDTGKRNEATLFAGWGGMPSVAIFRHGNRLMDPLTKARRHDLLGSAVAPAPSVSEEMADPIAADRIYAAWSTFLLARTRDTKAFPLLFEENMNYGFRRNLLGLRPIGIIICLLCCGFTAARLAQLYLSSQSVSAELAAALLIELIILALWLFQVSTEWVHTAAIAYAQRLAEAVDALPELRRQTT